MEHDYVYPTPLSFPTPLKFPIMVPPNFISLCMCVCV